MATTVKVFMHDGSEETAEIVRINKDSVLLQSPFFNGLVSFWVDSQGKAWGSDVHVAPEDVHKLQWTCSSVPFEERSKSMQDAMDGY